MPPPPELPDEFIPEILCRLPPDDPACLLRASLVCKSWRRILADPAFRRRHRELHPTPLVLGFVRIVRRQVPYASRFVPTDPASSRPAGRDLPGWLVLDCRHGRVLFVTRATDVGCEGTLDFIVWDPLTDERRHLPQPWPQPADAEHIRFNAAVLCAAAAEGCDHRRCHGGPFRVVYVFNTWSLNTRYITSARVYSSETGDWSEQTFVQDIQVFPSPMPCPTTLAGDRLYFFGPKFNTVEYQLGAHRLSVSRGPEPYVYAGVLMSTDNNEIRLVDVNIHSLSLRLWSRDEDANGVPQWEPTPYSEVELEALLPDGAVNVLASLPTWTMRFAEVIGSADGTDAIFVAVSAHFQTVYVYMLEINSRRAMKVLEDYHYYENYNYLFPYATFCIQGTSRDEES